MNNRKNFRNGFGMGQNMAMLLVVLPTLAFILTLMIDYWSVMQEDYKLKLLTNQVSMILDSEEDLRAQNLNETLATKVKNLCPNGTTLSFSTPADMPTKGQISVSINSLHNGHYFKNRTLTSQMQTYSYHDQNISITGTCQ
jgi:hypothetical protein